MVDGEQALPGPPGAGRAAQSFSPGRTIFVATGLFSLLLVLLFYQGGGTLTGRQGSILRLKTVVTTPPLDRASSRDSAQLQTARAQLQAAEQGMARLAMEQQVVAVRGNETAKRLEVITRDMQLLQEEVKKLHEGLKAASQEAERDRQGSLEAVSKELQGLRDELKALHNNMTAARAASQVGAMVMIEMREHPLLQYVLENFDANMPLGYDLYIFHDPKVNDFVARAAANVAKHRRVVQVHVPDYVRPEGEPPEAPYNALLKSPERFWHKIGAERVLVFQTDAVLCGASPFSISDFEHLAYIGCSYDTEEGRRSGVWGSNAFWGVGGLSFRLKSHALECIAAADVVEHRFTGNHTRVFPEDVFYSNCADAQLGRPPQSSQHLREFCTGRTFESKSFGAHGIMKHLIPEQLPAFLEYCPEARVFNQTGAR